MNIPTPLRALALAFALVSLPVTTTAARAQACDATVQARLDFLESRLDEGRTHAEWWWKSWLGIFIFGALVQSVNAGWEENKSERANDYMSVAKSLLGVADLSFRPMPGRHGADRMREIPTDTTEGCARRLHLAESVMKGAAERADSRRKWSTHVSSFALNFVAGLAVAEGWKDPTTGWSAFAVSQTMSEIHVWTAPGQPSDDWAAYRERFDGARAKKPSAWRLAGGNRGIGVVWNY